MNVKRRKIEIGLVIVLIGVVWILFQYWGNTHSGMDVRNATRSLFVWLVERWNDSAVSFGGNYSHGWLIPVISLWLLWRRREDLKKTEAGPAGLWGLSAVGAGLILHWMGLRAELPQLSAIGFIVLLWGMPTYLRGQAVGRILLFPCIFLLFAVPVNIFDSLTFPLRMLATVTASGLLNALGIPVTRIGTAIHSTVGQGFHLDVADPCSGIRSLTALMAIVAVYGYTTQKTTLRKWVLFVISLPLAVVGNIARVLAVGFVAAIFGSDIAVGAYHDYSGYVFYAVAISVMMIVAQRLDRIPVSSGSGESQTMTAPGPATGLESGGIPAWRSLTLLAMAGVALGVSVLAVTTKVEARPSLKAQLPARIQDWAGMDVVFCTNAACLKSFPVKTEKHPDVCPVCGGGIDHLSLPERTLLPADTLIVRKQYDGPLGKPASVTLVFSGRERSSIHRPEICLVSQGYRIVSENRVGVPLPGRAPLEIQVLELQTPGGGGRRGDGQLFAYWFVGGANRETPSHVRRILWMATDRIFRNTTMRWAYVSVLMPLDGDAGGVDELRQFISALYPSLAPESGADQ